MKKRPRMAHWKINLITTGCGSEAQALPVNLMTWVWWYSGWCKYSPHYIYFYYDWMDWKILKLDDHYGWKLRVQRRGFVSHSTKEKERQVCPGLKSAFLIIPIWLFQNRAISGLFFFTFVLSIQLKAENKISKWMDPNCGSLVSQATALPTEPQPLPNIFVFWTNEHNAVGLNLGVAALKKLFSTFCTNFCSTNDKCQGCRRSRMSRVQPFPGIGSASRRARERKKLPAFVKSFCLQIRYDTLRPLNHFSSWTKEKYIKVWNGKRLWERESLADLEHCLPFVSCVNK